MPDFDWDDGNRDHIARHGVTPEEAEEVYLSDCLELATYEENGELRSDLVGETPSGRILLVVVTMRHEAVRIVTCFAPGPGFRRAYLQYRASLL